MLICIKMNAQSITTYISSHYENGSSVTHISSHGEDDYKIKKNKSISKVYKVSLNDKLYIKNKFGKIHINTWDKNEMTIDIEIIARANDDSKVQKILDNITIDINDKSTNSFSFITQFVNDNMVMNKNSNFEINYTISMPKSNPLEVINSFGPVYLADFNGKLDLNLSYGNLKANKLNGETNNINIAFGPGEIAYAKQANLEISYSTFTLGKGEKIDLKSDFSEVSMEDIKGIFITSKYGSLNIEQVGDIEGSMNFSGCNISRLNGMMNLKTQYCNNFKIEKIFKNFKSINLEGSFSSYDLNFEPTSSFLFDTRFQFGDLKVKKDLIQLTYEEKKSFSNTYKGKFGKSPSTGNVKINAEYGDVKFKLLE